MHEGNLGEFDFDFEVRVSMGLSYQEPKVNVWKTVWRRVFTLS